MKEFNIIIEETVSQEFKVMAKTSEEAIEKVERGYVKEKYIVDNGDILEFKVMDRDAQ